jgi:hypothetical protein
VVRRECDISVDHLYKWALKVAERWILKCNTSRTEGEEETSWRHKEHDNSIITRAFFITRGSTQWVCIVGLMFVSDDDVLFIGTRFSNLYTAVDTPA